MKVRELFDDRVFTLSNFISLSRIIAAPFMAWLMIKEAASGDKFYMMLELAVFALIIASDFFDGFFARVLKQESRLGQFLDPFADKISGLSIIILLTIYKGFPLWLTLSIWARETIFFFAAYFLFSKRDVAVKPNIFGKICVGSGALSTLIFIMSLDTVYFGYTVKDISIFLIILFYVLGGILYVKTYFNDYFKK